MNRALSHENIVALKEVILEDKSIYMVFEYAEHDFLVRPHPSLIHIQANVIPPPTCSKSSITTHRPYGTVSTRPFSSL